MSEITPTAEQAEAINAREGALLISAGAGSGKTRVLVERVFSRLTDSEKRCDINELLIITFTNAAAAELRDRVMSKLGGELAKNPGDARLRRQYALCRCAEIGTIHSFLGKIIRENAHALNIPPDFRIAEEHEAGVIRAEILTRVLEARYEEMPEGFAELTDTLSPGRDDRRLGEIVSAAYDKLMSHRDPDGWMERQLSHVSPGDGFDAADSPWGEYIMSEARDTAGYWHRRMTEIADRMDKDSADKNQLKVYKAYNEAIALLDALLRGLDQGWDSARNALSIKYPALNGRAAAPEIAANTWDKCRMSVWGDKTHQGIRQLFECSSAEFTEDMRAVSPTLTALFALTRDFRNAYDAEKARRRLLDFNDIEHMCVKLLINKDGSQTPLASELSARYREVMVDEYQDVSALQDTLINAVSGGGRNLVMVGDARQSIYRFRLAEPKIFISRYKSFNETGDNGKCVVLSSNFRSSGNIIAAVNHVFANIMSEKAGEMDYGEREYLRHGRGGGDGAAVELSVIDISASGEEDEDEGEESIGALEAEARFVANRVCELVGSGYTAPDENGGSRAVEYGDIAILVRSMRSAGKAFRDALTAYGIPVASPEQEEFFEHKEVELALAFLSVIDNPRQDIPLIAMLGSSVYGFTPGDLAEVRAALPGGEFYDALTTRAETDARSRAFLGELDALRALSREVPADELLWRVYDSTGMLAVVSSWEKGERRRRNLVRLAELARSFEEAGRQGLHGFLEYAERLRAKEYKAAGEGIAGGVVRIMTVHSSKGLEFPVVFLPYLGRNIYYLFNTKEKSKPVLFHPELGAGLKRVELDRGIEYPTLPRQAIERRLRAELLSEELRLLYVAMTRAREKLIISCAFKNAASLLSGLRKDAASPVSPYTLAERNDIASCLLLAVLSRPEAARLTDLDAAAGDSGAWDMSIVPARSLKPLSAVKTAAARDTVRELPPEPKAFVYPHARAVDLPSKLTVTELRGRSRDTETAEDASRRIYTRETAPRHPYFIERDSPPTGAERGTAIHAVMRVLDFSACESASGVRDELERLEAEGLISAEQREAAGNVNIAGFFASDIGAAAIRADAAGAVYREFKFSLLRRAEELFGEAETSVNAESAISPEAVRASDEILFQGVVDLAFADGGALTIVDFKTDRVFNAAAIREKTERYAYQVREYALAMSRVTGLPVARGVIYFLDAGEYAEVAL